jgi:hypothetical protein
MSRKEANDISSKLVDMYENDLLKPPTGKKYQDCFNVQNSTPSSEYQEFYKSIKKKIKDLGVSFKG